MKKIGIITMLYKSINYGGVLQAYALCKVVEKAGYSAEQILYEWKCGSVRKQRKKLLNLVKRISRKLDLILKNKFTDICLTEKKEEAEKILSTRKEVFDKFKQEKIPCSARIYSAENIDEAEDKFDVFITGSDQVWGTFSIDRGYSLGFTTKKSIAYAVSGNISLHSEEAKKFYEAVTDSFHSISVREDYNKKILQSITSKNITHTVDPTLLLTKEEWDDISSDYKVEEKYIFCYFLGEGKKYRNIALDFAKKMGLKTVFLPHLKGTCCFDDFCAGDYQPKDISPADFIALVKNAEYIFTDSFHACVFSSIYEKQFYVFKREDCGGFERIENLMEILNSKHRIVNLCKNVSAEDISNINPMLYEKNEKLEAMKKESLSFLIDAIED